MQSVLLLLVSCVAGCVVAAPASLESTATPIPILMDERIPIDQYGGYGFRIQTGNDVTWVERAEASGPTNEVTRTGQYRFVHPDGTVHLLTYTAGVNGFQPISDMLPTPHPLEPWHLEQIAFAEKQKAEAAARKAAEEEVEE
ncbi:cuticle protein AM1199-like [Portunus trituberculatus]|uniref:cuticle protein AM1199-like n=1 Tax=Portunus trituberculatus TaxID=210409 RepID=UPI001E1CE316|nr:cuticle protein AM1199-like [Portunus trituberculatus]